MKFDMQRFANVTLYSAKNGKVTETYDTTNDDISVDLGNATGILPVTNGGTGQTVLSAVTVGKANTLTTAQNIIASLGSTTAGSFDGTAAVTVGTQGTLPVAKGGTGQTVLSAVTVGKANSLTTAQNIIASLGTTTAGSFNGSSAVTVGTQGTLPVSKGGTGATIASTARTNLGLGAVSTYNTLGIANGGTAMTVSPSMLTNLGSTTAANIFTASPRPGVTGILPVANGGTGSSLGALTGSLHLSDTSTVAGVSSKTIKATRGNRNNNKDVDILVPYLPANSQANSSGYGLGVILRGTQGFVLYSGDTLSSWSTDLAIDGEGISLVADDNIVFCTGMDSQYVTNGSWANRKTFTFKPDGSAQFPGRVNAVNASLSGNATVAGSATITGGASISGGASINGNVSVKGDVTVSGFSYINSGAAITGGATVTGGEISGTVSSAVRLKTARNIIASLDSTTAGSFDGSAAVTVGTQGTLPVTKGGTGATIASTARTNLGLGSIATLSSPLPIANGGTGLTTGANLHYFGTCSTAAATANKVVTCSGFVLATGAKITVNFTYTNTATTMTLNVNSTGEKTVVGNYTSTTGTMYNNDDGYASGIIMAGYPVTFVYTGTYWALDRTTTFLTAYSNGSILRHSDMMALNYMRIMRDTTSSIYHSYSTTAAGTANKVVVCPELTSFDSDFLLYVTFSVTNTATTPKLNINSLGAKSIAGIANSTSNNNMNLVANYVHVFQYKKTSDTLYLIHKMSQYEVRSSWYITCSTAAATVKKVNAYARTDERLFCLTVGITIYLNLTVANTAANPTLNINNTGALPVYNGSTRLTGSAMKAGLYHLTYNGTNYVVINMPA